MHCGLLASSLHTFVDRFCRFPLPEHVRRFVFVVVMLMWGDTVDAEGQPV